MTSIDRSNVAVANTGDGNINITGPINLHDIQSKIEELPFEYFPLPRLIETFRGRDEEMIILDSLLFTEAEAERKVVICGLPGFGKTELTKQFAQRCLNNGKVTRVLWIKAEKKEDVEHSYPKLKKIYEQCDDSCLCVFDNGLCRRDIADFEPPASDNFFMIVTSNEMNWGEDVMSVKLHPLNLESAIDVFKFILKDNYKEEDYPSYVQLADDVMNNVPLGLQIIAGFVRQQTSILTFNLSEYVQIIKQSLEIMKKKIPRDVCNSYEKTIYGALEVSVNKIKEEEDTKVRDLTLNMLYVCSYLNPDNIYIEDMLKVSIFKSIYNNKTQLELSLELLVNYCLVNRSIGLYRRYIGMHRLVQKFLRLYLREVKLESIYFSSCLYAAIFDNQFSRHTKSVASHADTYVDIVYNFYKEQKSNVEKVLNWLVQFGCIACLNKIFADKNEKKYIIQCRLLFTAIKYHQTNILAKLLSYAKINEKYEVKYILSEAIEKSNWNTMNILINYGADMHVRNKEGDIPLFEFIKNKNLSAHVKWEEILRMFNFKFNKNVVNNHKETILHLAAAHCHADLIDILVVQYEMNINQQDSRGRTPLLAFYYNSLLEVCSSKIIAILEVFLKHNASLYIEDLDGSTTGYLLLNFFIKSNKLDVLNWLLTQNFDFNCISINNQTVLHTTSTFSNLEIINNLIKFGADVNAKNTAGNIPLFLFTKRKDLTEDIDWKEILRLFKFDKLSTNNDRETLLHLAADKFLSNLIKILLVDYEMNINQQDILGRTPLHVLYYNISLLHVRSPELIAKLEVFIKHNASLDIKDSNGCTVGYLLLNYVVKYNELNGLKWLLQKKVDINSISNNATVLHTAAAYSNIKIINNLIRFGADVQVKDTSGDIPLFLFTKRKDLSEDMDWNEILRLFKFDKTSTNNDKESLLHIAAVNFLHDLIEILLVNYKMNVDKLNIYKKTPLDTLLYNFIMSKDYSTKIEGLDKTIKILVQFIKHGASVINTEFDFSIPLKIVRENELQALEWLLQHDVKSYQYCQSLLELAVEEGHLEAAKICIKHGANIHAKNKYDSTVIWFFICNGYNSDMDKDKVNDFLETLDCSGQKHLSHQLLHLAAVKADEKLMALLMQKFKLNKQETPTK